MALPERFRVQTSPLPHPDQVVRGDRWRITVLTERLLRLEWSNAGVFEDRPTQVVWHRAMPPVPFEVVRRGEEVQLTTPYLQLFFDGQPFSPGGLGVTQRHATGWHTVWRYGMPDRAQEREPGWHVGNLGGTARTLDEADGGVPLEPGVVSALGWATLDDTASLALDADGWPAPRVGDIDL